MGLFKPAWMGNNKNRAINSLEKITDDKELIDIAKNAPLTEVKCAAIDRIKSIDNLLIAADRTLLIGDAAREHASQVLVERLRLAKDRDELLVEKVLRNIDLGISGKKARRSAALMLPKDHPVLDAPCCPRCGCVKAVFDYRYLKYTPIGYEGFRCTSCGEHKDVYQFDMKERGIPKPADFSVPLRKFLQG